MTELRDNEVLSMDGLRPLADEQFRALLKLLEYYRKVSGNKASIGNFTRAFIKDWGNGIIRNFLVFQAIMDGEVAFDVLPSSGGFEICMTKTRDNFTADQIKGIDSIIDEYKREIEGL